MEDSLFKKPVMKQEAGVLARLWRNILRDDKLESNVERLIDKMLAENSKTTSAALRKMTRSSIRNKVTTDKMSMKTFILLVFRMLRAKQLDITITIDYGFGRKGVHSIALGNNSEGLNLDELLKEDDEENEDEEETE